MGVKEGEEEGGEKEAPKDPSPYPNRPRPNPDYKDARVTITLGPGEEKEVAIPCDFKPERVVVDPDVNVLQLNRTLAFAEVGK